MCCIYILWVVLFLFLLGSYSALYGYSCLAIQCENGHIACASCCTKLGNRCPSCSWPIGYNRCRAIEKVLESVKVSCQNIAYGCQETMSYGKKHEHEVTCHYVPCSCPHSNCNFRGSSEQLAEHLRSGHLNSMIHFQYNSIFPVHLESDAVDKFRILIEAREGSLFIVSSSVQQLGHAVTVCGIGPGSSSSKGGGHPHPHPHAFNLAARKGDRSIKLQSFTQNIREVVEIPSHSTGFLLLPNAFMGSSGRFTLELCIRGNNVHPIPAKKIKIKWCCLTWWSTLALNIVYMIAIPHLSSPLELVSFLIHHHLRFFLRFLFVPQISASADNSSWVITGDKI